MRRLGPARVPDPALGRRGGGHRRMRSEDGARGRDLPGRVGELLEEIKASGNIELHARARPPPDAGLMPTRCFYSKLTLPSM